MLFRTLIVLLLAAIPVACGKAATLPPKAVELNDAGALALEQGDLETAGARFNLALEYNPEFVEALTNLGLVEIKRGNFERARQLLSRARRLNPDIAQPHHALGVLAERMHQPDTASSHYREALKVDPGFSAARANLGKLLLEANLHEHALVQFRRLREVAPKDPVSHRGYIEALMSLGRHEEARTAVRGAIAIFPDDPGLTILKARTAVHDGQLPEALALLTPVSNRGDSFSLTALAWMAVTELASGHPRRAVGAAQRALTLDPNHPLSVYAIAMALDDLKDPAARTWLEKALTLNPNNPVIAERLSQK